MKFKLFSALLTCLLVFPGCFPTKSTEFKNQISVSNAKLKVASEEFKTAQTVDEKIEIATDYFATAPRELQLLDDTAWGRDPSTDALTPDISGASTPAGQPKSGKK